MLTWQLMLMLMLMLMLTWPLTLTCSALGQLPKVGVSQGIRGTHV
jgi:hypothetical protein